MQQVAWHKHNCLLTSGSLHMRQPRGVSTWAWDLGRAVTAHTETGLTDVSVAASLPLGMGRRAWGWPYRLVGGEWRVSRHEEVQPGRGDQRGNQPNEVIVHVAGIPECGGAGRHDGGDLGESTGSAERCRACQNLPHADMPREAGVPGRAQDPRSQLQGANSGAQPMKQVQTQLNTAGKPHAGFS